MGELVDLAMRKEQTAERARAVRKALATLEEAHDAVIGAAMSVACVGV